MIQKPKTDPVIDEIHAVRRDISDRFNGDVHAISADANARMLASGCSVWTPADNHPMHRSGGGDRSQMENQSPPPGDR
ncbi:hypothetical protein LF1_55490 [Rubripirellula obstinata]|uniref:Uncharacterized protein n=1 Tax=Rubripirellula obstinata TaxID=406547 RepID=A0A5B1CBW7_9BACT|nr:hypothetical protein [Rubripirellula obstinata]KAA1257149.1 hypothetical protein LF1_55490 [Rubripirellula obstinata]